MGAVSAPSEQRLRIGHVTGSFPPSTYHGGPIESAYGLCKALADLGHEVRVLTTNADGPGRRAHVELNVDTAIVSGLTVCYAPSLTDRPFSPSLLRRLPELVRWADVVHVTGVYEHHTIPALFGCRVLDVPLVWSPRGALQRWQHVRRTLAKAAWDRTCQRALPLRCAIHVTSLNEARASTTRLRGATMVLIPNGIDIPSDEALAVRARRASGSPMELLFLGRLHPIKAIERLLEAMALVQRRGVEVRLVIAGDGEARYQRSLQVLAERMDLGRSVRFAGHVKGTVKEQVIRAADVLVLPSFSENFGIVVAEALANGVPVIASRGTPWHELERQGCGRWVRNDPESLAGAIVELQACDVAAMGAKGRRWMSRSFSWKGAATRMAAVYRALRAGGALPDSVGAPLDVVGNGTNDC